MYGVLRSIFECIREREFNGILPSDCFAALAAIREEVEDEKMSPTASRNTSANISEGES